MNSYRGVFDRHQERPGSVGIEFITWRAEINQVFCHAERLGISRD